MLHCGKTDEELRQWCLEDLLNRIYDFTRIKRQCSSDIENQAESDEQGEFLSEITRSLNIMIERSCRYRAANYYGPEAGG